MNITSGYLQHHLLIATPELRKGIFHRSVAYVFEHNADGAMGLVVNRPMAMSLGDILREADIDATSDQVDHIRIHHGGPVHQERGFILHKGGREWESTLTMDNGMAITTSQDILQDIAKDQGPEQPLIALGFAGWSAEQLENEIKDNAWLIVPASEELLFEVPDHKRWEYAARTLGIDIAQLCTQPGHA